MPPKPKEQPTRVQPHRSAKTPPTRTEAESPPSKRVRRTTGGQVAKSTSPKLAQKQLKPPGKGVATVPSTPDAGIGDDEETDTENSFSDVNDGRDNFLKPADIVVGNIISTGYHEAYAELTYRDYEYRSKYVRESGDSCGHVHSKYRKFVIVALFKKHFVSLPIYSQRFKGLDTREDYAEYAEILDSTLKRLKPPYLPRERPVCRGSTDNIWLWSTAHPIANRSWARMADTSVAWMAKPVAHRNDIRAKVVSKLDKESEELLLRWARNCLVEGLEVGVKEHLRVLRREDIKAPTVTGPGPWAK